MWRSLLAFTPALVLPACDGLFPPGDDPGDGPRPGRIVGVEVAPDPVVVGDTATFTVVTMPSYGAFVWNLRGMDETVETTVNRVQWVAPDSASIYEHRVTVYSQASPVTDTTFTVRVVEPL